MIIFTKYVTQDFCRFYRKIIAFILIGIHLNVCFAAAGVVNTLGDPDNTSQQNGSLRQVMNWINANGSGSAIGDNTIELPTSGTISLTLGDLPVLTKGTTIAAPSGSITIDGGASRLFATFESSLALGDSSSAMILQNGKALGGTGGGGGLGAGGAVYIDLGQTLSLINTTIQNCNAQGGSGGASNRGGGGASFSIANKNATGFDGAGDFPGLSPFAGSTGGLASRGVNGYGGGAGGVGIGGPSGSGGSGGGNTAGSIGGVSSGGAGGYCGGGGGGVGFTGSSTGSFGGNGGGGNPGGDGAPGSIESGAGGGGYGSGGGLSAGGAGGGFGGGGAGTGSAGGGGGGGFGAGGGCSTSGRGAAGTGGYFAGTGASGVGGGGAGIGGGVFISDSASLQINNGVIFSGNTVTPGTGGSGSEGYADAIFLFKGASILFDGNTDLTTAAIQGDTHSDSIGSNSDAGITVSTSGGAKIILGSSSTNYKGNTTITSGGILESTGANLPGTQLALIPLTPGSIIVESGGTFNLSSGTFPTNTIVDNQSGGITNIAGTFAPASTSTNAGTMNINTGGSFTQPGTYTYTGTINVNTGTTPFGSAITGTGSSILNIGPSVACSYSTSGNITGIVAVNVKSGSTLTLNNTLSGGALTNESGGSLVFASGANNSNTITNSASANFNVTGASTNSATITNSGNMTISSTLAGAGTITNNASANLAVQNLASIANVINNSGEMSVSGNVTMANVTNNGTLSISASTINMSGSTLSGNGDVTVTGANTLEATSYANSGTHNTSITSQSTFDKLDVTGNVNITGDINVSSSFVGMPNIIYTWPILSATGTFTVPAPVLPAGFWSSSVIGGNTLQISYLDSISPEYPDLVSGTVNEEIARVLQDIANNITNAGQQELIDAFNANIDSPNFNSYVQEMTPVASTISATSLAQNTILNKIAVRAASVAAGNQESTGITTGDLGPDTSIWMAGLGNFAKQSQRGENYGYRAYVWGGMLGFDTLTSNSDIFGIGLAFLNFNIHDFASYDFSTRSLSYNGFVYGTNYLYGNTFLEWALGAGWNKNKGNRHILVGSYNFSTAAHYDSYQGSIRLDLGNRADISILDFTQFLRLQYNAQYSQAYEETQSVAALNIGSSKGLHYLACGGGIRLSLPSDNIWIYGSREVYAAATYDVISSNQITTANFIVGSPSFTMINSPARFAVQCGASMSFTICETIQLQLNYDLELRSGFYNNSCEAKLRLMF